MAGKNIADIVKEVVAALEDLSSEERHRVVNASMTLLGETAVASKVQSPGFEGDVSDLPARTQSWIKQNGLSVDQLEQVFHRGDEGFELIAAEVPGKNNRERVRSAYVLFGVAKFLATGLANFDDKEARALCEKLGIYDQTNHAKYMKGSEFAGTKDKGWILTAPGLKYGASLVSQLAQ